MGSQAIPCRARPNLTLPNRDSRQRSTLNERFPLPTIQRPRVTLERYRSGGNDARRVFSNGGSPATPKTHVIENGWVTRFAVAGLLKVSSACGRETLVDDATAGAAS